MGEGINPKPPQNNPSVETSFSDIPIETLRMFVGQIPIEHHRTVVHHYE